MPELDVPELDPVLVCEPIELELPELVPDVPEAPPDFSWWCLLW